MWPFSTWFAYRDRVRERELAIRQAERDERRQEREAFLAALDSMKTVAAAALASAERQSDVVSKFLDSFNVTEPPQLREFDVDAADRRYLARRATAGDTAVPELEGLNQFDSFKKILDRMES